MNKNEWTNERNELFVSIIRYFFTAAAVVVVIQFHPSRVYCIENAVVSLNSFAHPMVLIVRVRSEDKPKKKNMKNWNKRWIKKESELKKTKHIYDR